MKWIIAFLIFSLLILFHEFGHFLVAKLNGVEVEEFSMGFGPRILTTVYHGTRYSLKLLLFGGSCQMKGMMEEYYDDEDDEVPETERVPEEGSFESVSVGRRAAIIFAGPLFNFILAFICAIIIIGVVGYDPAEIMSVAENSAADKAGILPGDTITSFMGNHVDIARDVSTWFALNDLKEDDTVTLTVTRDGEKKDVTYEPDVISRYMLGLTYNLDDVPATINAVSEGSPLDEAGVRAGDVVLAIDGTEITGSNEMNEYFDAHPMDGSEVTLAIQRGDETLEKKVVPYENRSVSLGFSYNMGRVNTSAIGVLKYSVIEMRYWIGTVLKSLGALFTGRYGMDELSGPVGVVDIVGTTYEETKDEGPLITWMNMLNMIVLLSANLGVMNLLPIPALDGGRLVFLLLEGIMRRPVNKKVEGTLQMITVVLLLFLMVYVMYNDLTRLLTP